MNNIVIDDNLNNSDNSNCDAHFVDSKLSVEYWYYINYINVNNFLSRFI